MQARTIGLKLKPGKMYFFRYKTLVDVYYDLPDVAIHEAIGKYVGRFKSSLHFFLLAGDSKRSEFFDSPIGPHGIGTAVPNPFDIKQIKRVDLPLYIYLPSKSILFEKYLSGELKL